MRGRIVNIKRLLRFYYSAENLNAAMDSAIERLAVQSADSYIGGEYYAEKISLIVAEKSELSALWGYLDTALSDIGERGGALKHYAAARHGVESFGKAEEKAVRRAAAKFARRISRGICAYRAGVALVDEWYCIMRMDE